MEIIIIICLIVIIFYLHNIDKNIANGQKITYNSIAIMNNNLRILLSGLRLLLKEEDLEKYDEIEKGVNQSSEKFTDEIEELKRKYK